MSNYTDKISFFELGLKLGSFNLFCFHLSFSRDSAYAHARFAGVHVLNINLSQIFADRKLFILHGICKVVHLLTITCYTSKYRVSRVFAA